MIRTFTIVENKQGNGNVEYSVSGDLPIDEVASAIVRIALHTERPSQKKEEIKSPDQPQPLLS